MHAPSLLALLVLVLLSLPRVVLAQSGAMRADSLATAVRLTQPGIHRVLAHTLLPGLQVLDRQDVDVDADGDLDALLLLDRADANEEPSPSHGRGVVVVFREPRGWRAETVASVAGMPLEAGYSWGSVEPLRAGEAPLLHVFFSRAGVTGEELSDTVLRFEGGALREVFARAVTSVPGTGPEAVTRTLTVQSADLDGDGTRELLERVAESRACPEGECQQSDGMFAPVITRRVWRWEPARGLFVEDPAARGRLREAERALAEATARGRAGDLAGRDAAIARAYALDPLESAVRMAFARLQLRQGAPAAALETLSFAWPEGYGGEARRLRAEAAVRADDPQCGGYLGALAEEPGAQELVALLAQRSPCCLGPGK
jgi:hypothetical protein